MSETNPNPALPTPQGPTAEQLAALAPFQSQLTWVASQEHARGRQEGARQLVEELGMPLEEIKAKLKTPAPAQAPAQDQPNADLERRIKELEERSVQMEQREAKLNEREATLTAREQDGLKVEALEELGMTTAQAKVAVSMMQLPAGVTEVTPELAKASAEQLKTTFPALFEQKPPADGEQQGAGQQPTGTPTDTRTRGTQGTTAGVRGTQSAADRANDRLAARGHVRPAAG